MERGDPALGVHPEGLRPQGDARQPLTGIAQQAWAARLHGGDWAIDATAGNGHDTEFLARAVAPGGRVFAIDIQESAIRATARRLERAGLSAGVTLVKGDHARMRDLLACGLRGRIRLVCFNLGYLPSGDHSIVTRPESTLAALHESLLLLDPEGALSVIAYRGHSGAAQEAGVVEQFFQHLPRPWRLAAHMETGSAASPGPVWWMASAGD